MRIWIDIENPPQVGYLLPFKSAFEALGNHVVVTARDYGSTVEMLAQADVRPPVFGTRIGANKLHKATAIAVRARQLIRFFATAAHPDVLLAASRSAAVAARWMQIPSFIIGDYEHADPRPFGWTRSTMLYPDVIDRAKLVRGGLRPAQLAPFAGLKEDLTFATIDVDAVEPHSFGDLPPDLVRVLFRPPSQTCHYYREASIELARATLAHVARAGALVVFSPREATQAQMLDGLDFAHPPVALSSPLPCVPLLKGVDAVVCSGGTMLREAAYLGIPAYSIFQSEIGAVDRWLEGIGRVAVIDGVADLGQIQVERRGPLRRLDTNPRLLDELVSTVIAGASTKP